MTCSGKKITYILAKNNINANYTLKHHRVSLCHSKAKASSAFVNVFVLMDQYRCKTSLSCIDWLDITASESRLGMLNLISRQ